MAGLIFHSNELKTLSVARYYQLRKVPVKIYDQKKKFTFDDSFCINGQVFDCGYHAIDIGRDKIWDEISESLGLEWTITAGSRMMALLERLLPRYYDSSEISDVVSLANKNKFEDPFLQHLESRYGTDFVKYSIDHIAQSYAPNVLWKNAGFDSRDCLRNIYPWFFPGSAADSGDLIDSHYHYKEASSPVKYPSEGGFELITYALRDLLAQSIVNLPQPSDNLLGEFNDSGLFISSGSNEEGVHIVSIDYLDLVERFSLPLPAYQETYFYLVSIVLEKPIDFECNEILVGDDRYLFDRLSSPDFQHAKKNITSLQVEAEHVDALNEDKLLENIREFVDKFLGNAPFKEVDIKTIRPKRFCDPNLAIKTQAIIDWVENKNPQVLVANRSLNFANLADSIPALVGLIGERKL